MLLYEGQEWRKWINVQIQLLLVLVILSYLEDELFNQSIVPPSSNTLSARYNLFWSPVEKDRDFWFPVDISALRAARIIDFLTLVPFIRDFSSHFIHRLCILESGGLFQ